MARAYLRAAPDEEGGTGERHHEADEEGGREPLPEDQPRPYGDEDGREVYEQRGVGDGGQFDRPVPQAEVPREEEAREGQADEVPVPGRTVRLRPPVPDLHPQPQDGEREGEAVEGR